ncbi:MAG: (2Fe-2S)-binding protein [Myxococcota bacterium]
MIVCHCEAVTDRDIRQSVAEGACSLRQVARACGAGRQCGGCLPVVEALLGQPTQRVVHRQPAAAPLAALG